MNLKTMDPHITLKLLEGRVDVITPLAAEREAFYQSQTCPQCLGTSLKKTGDVRFMFRPGEALPRYWLECDGCRCVFDPHTGLVVKMGNIARSLEPAIPILPDRED